MIAEVGASATGTTGLSEAEARRLLGEYGPNEIHREAGLSPWVILGASLMGLPLPLTALQILWINLVTDGLPAITLVMDPPDADVLRRAPRRPEAAVHRAREWRRIVFARLLEASVVLSVFVWALGARDEIQARNLALSVLVFAESLRAFAARNPDRVFFDTGIFSSVRLRGVGAPTVPVTVLELFKLARRGLRAFGVGSAGAGNTGTGRTAG